MRVVVVVVVVGVLVVDEWMRMRVLLCLKHLKSRITHYCIMYDIILD